MSRWAPRIVPCLFGILVGSAWGCASDVQIHTLRSPTAHFEAYRTIAFDLPSKPPPAFSASSHSGEVREQVQQEAARILKERGYELVPGTSADLVVRIEVGRRHEEVPLTTGTMPVGGEAIGVAAPSSPPGTMGPTGTANVAGPGEIEPAVHGQLDEEHRDLVEGAFVIDVFDARTRQIVWHGSAHAQVNPGSVDYEHLHESVQKVLASFPARSGG